MSAGDNTLNQLCSLQIAKVLSKHPAPTSIGNLSPLLGEAFEVWNANMIDNQLFLFVLPQQSFQAYVKFMTTPGTHNDTYADSFHRLFFSDWRDEDKPTDKDKILKFVESR